MSKTYVNGHDLPISVAAWLAHDDYVSNPDIVSATQLLQSTRKLVLSFQAMNSTTIHTTPADVMSMMKSRKGTAVHNAIENTWTNGVKRIKALMALGYSEASAKKFVVNIEPEDLEKGQIPVYTERYCEREIGDYAVGGTADFIIKGRLSDFKNTSTYSYMDETKAKAYQLQGSVYRWAMPDIITEDEMDIIEMYDDWTAARAFGSGYPSAPIIVRKIPLLSLPATERYISNKIKDVAAAIQMDEEDIPLCNDQELWRKEDTYKFYSKADATGKSTKNFSNYKDALKHFNEAGAKGRIDHVKGGVVACRFCDAIGICGQAKRLIASGELVLK